MLSLIVAYRLAAKTAYGYEYCEDNPRDPQYTEKRAEFIELYKELTGQCDSPVVKWPSVDELSAYGSRTFA